MAGGGGRPAVSGWIEKIAARGSAARRKGRGSRGPEESERARAGLARVRVAGTGRRRRSARAGATEGGGAGGGGGVESARAGRLAGAGGERIKVGRAPSLWSGEGAARALTRAKDLGSLVL